MGERGSFLGIQELQQLIAEVMIEDSTGKQSLTKGSLTKEVLNVTMGLEKFSTEGCWKENNLEYLRNSPKGSSLEPGQNNLIVNGCLKFCWRKNPEILCNVPWRRDEKLVCRLD